MLHLFPALENYSVEWNKLTLNVFADDQANAELKGVAIRGAIRRQHYRGDCNQSEPGVAYRPGDQCREAQYDHEQRGKGEVAFAVSRHAERERQGEKHRVSNDEIGGPRVRYDSRRRSH
jgi:hypothetical protein